MFQSLFLRMAIDPRRSRHQSIETRVIGRPVGAFDAEEGEMASKSSRVLSCFHQ
jgi:hypothetical protein